MFITLVVPLYCNWDVTLSSDTVKDGRLLVQLKTPLPSVLIIWPDEPSEVGNVNETPLFNLDTYNVSDIFPDPTTSSL